MANSSAPRSAHRNPFSSGRASILVSLAPNTTLECVPPRSNLMVEGLGDGDLVLYIRRAASPFYGLDLMDLHTVELAPRFPAQGAVCAVSRRSRSIVLLTSQ